MIDEPDKEEIENVELEKEVNQMNDEVKEKVKAMNMEISASMYEIVGTVHEEISLLN